MDEVRAAVAAGGLAKAGVWDASGIDTCARVIETVQGAGIETIRVLFCDQHGILRGKTIVSRALGDLFAEGLAAPSTLLLKDTAHRTVFEVWSATSEVAGGMRGAGNVLLVPDPDTFRILPWSDHSAWILCDLRYPDGADMPLCTRTILQQQIARLAAQGQALHVGLEVEFHVFRMLDARLDPAGATLPGQPPQTENIAQGYQLLTELRYDAMEPVMDRLRRTCEGLGMPIRSMEVEMGPSQIEFTFDPADPLTHADNMVMLRTAVKEVCAREGLHATFMCKPGVDNAAASGWHLHQSLLEVKSGENLFVPDQAELTPWCSGWIAGLLAHAAASTMLSTPTVNGYKRYQPHQLAPNRVVWGRDNRGAMIRDLTHAGRSASRIENRVAEPAANPYLFFASQIIAGTAGLAQGLQAPPPVEDPYDSEAMPLPENLQEAIGAFSASTLYRASLGDAFVDYLCQIRRSEWDRYQQSVSAWEQQEYFGIF